MTDIYSDLLPFGAQYYRAPTPLECDWENDLAAMEAAGFNLIKIWAVWRSNNPVDGVYDFSDLEKLMDIAERHSLRLIVNLIFDAAPSWFYKKHPESMMITADGRKIYPKTNACRQSGGYPGPCLHHPEGIRIRREFTEKLVEKLGNHPALLCWDVWNEPFLGGGFENDMACYCENTFERFVSWLKKRYGTIEGLNAVWHTYYGSFDDVEMPTCREAFRNMIDWRLFFSETLTEEAKMRIDAVKRHDSLHPVMLHTVPMLFFSGINGCSDDYRLAAKCDWFGNSLGSFPYTATISKSAAPGKRVISSEIHAVGGTTFGRPIQPDLKILKRHILIPLSRGIKGFCFWQYRPERIGIESPAWGLTNTDGTPSEWLTMSSEINRKLQKHKDAILSSEPEKADVAVVNSLAGQIFCYCADGSGDKYCNSVIGAFDMLHNAGYRCDIVSPDRLTEEGFDGYKLIYLPFPYYLDGRFAEALKKWVNNGGCLISEAFFGGYSADDGLHSTKTPGFGFTEVFGVTEGRVMTASQFRNAYSEKWSADSDSASVPFTCGDKELSGYYFSEGLIPDTAEPVAYFADGVPAVTVNRYGKGIAVMAGTLVGAAKRQENAALIDMIAEKAGVIPTARCGIPDIRVDRVGKLLFVCSNSGKDTVCTLSVGTGRFTDILTDEVFTAEDGKIAVPVSGNDIRCFAIIV